MADQAEQQAENSIVRPRSSTGRRGSDGARRRTPSAQYSAGPELSAILETTGREQGEHTVAIDPAPNDPMAAGASAGTRAAALRHLIALETRWRSTADSAGVVSRMVVVDPPYYAPASRCRRT